MKFVRPLALLAAAAATALLPVAADAASAKHTDPKGDVQYFAVNSQGVPTNAPAKNAPTYKNGDIRTVKSTYTGSTITVTTTYTALGKVGDLLEHFVDVHAGKNVRTVVVDAYKGKWGGVIYVMDQKGNEISAKKCAPTAKLDYAKKTITVKVPAKCLATPASVKVGAGTSTYVGKKLYADDAYRTKGIDAAALKVSPTIKRN